MNRVGPVEEQRCGVRGEMRRAEKREVVGYGEEERDS